MTKTTERAAGLGLAILILAVGPLAASGDRPASSEDRAGTNLICQTCDPPDPPPSPRPSPTPTPPPPPSFTTLMARYTPYDINGDRIREIESLKPLFANPEPYHAAANGVVLVLVNPSLVSDEAGIQKTRAEMSFGLGILGADIARDGFFPYFIEASVFAGSNHQDGRTLLALRRFLKEVRSYYPLAGVLLVGSFPDAAIVRSVFAKNNAEPDPDHPLHLASGAEPISPYVGPYVSLRAEYITPRAEIVLGDLDGNWEALYRPSLSFTNYDAAPLEPSGAYPHDGQILETPHYHGEVPVSYPDVFYIQDHQVSISISGGWLRLSIASLVEPSPEVSALDRQRPNRIARPEIHVSRIDPLRVALMPRILPPLTDGQSLLDADGRPQKVRTSGPPTLLWNTDRNLERRLVLDYIARSHDFRLGHDNWLPFRTSAVRSTDLELASPAFFNGLLRRASDAFGPSIATDDADLYDYVEWLKKPAVLRGISAHSDAVMSQFGDVSAPGDVEMAAGGFDWATGSHVWRWVPRQESPQQWVLEPSFAGLDGNARFPVYRTMWENGVLASSGQAFFVHDGCEVTRPLHAETTAYNGPEYGWDRNGRAANAESLMFYANGLGLMARNKVFYDVPSGFFDGVRNWGRFGYGWRQYFFADAENASLNENAVDPTVVDPGHDRRWVTLQRKRSYFWSLIGDFTLKIRY